MVRVPGIDYSALDALAADQKRVSQDSRDSRESRDLDIKRKAQDVSRDLETSRDTAARPELDELIDRQRRGELTPVGVVLRLPADLSADARLAIEDMAWLWGLFAAVGEHRPMPYSSRFCARRLGWVDGQRRAFRAIRELESVGAIRCVVRLKPRGGLVATKCYVLCPAG